MQTWYSKCLPRIRDIRDELPTISAELKKISGVKKLYVFGSVALHFDNDDFRVKDIDIIAQTPFHSEDLTAIKKSDLSYKTSYLEEQGYDIRAVKFSKSISNYKPEQIDVWCLSSDKKLLHWGPIGSLASESDELRLEAEEHASKITGLDTKTLKTASNEHRVNWFSNYQRYIEKHYSEMPSGWYCSEENDVKIILSKAREI